MELLSLLNVISSQSTLLYIDPAATSVLLSSVAAVGVAVAASAIIIWRKIKNKTKKILKTDPNKNKEVEKDIAITDNSLLNEDIKNSELKTEEKVEMKEQKEIKNEKKD